MWVYQQSTGRLYHGTTYVATGYAGHGDGCNNPDMQAVEGVGPLPVGVYDIGQPFDHPHTGPYSMRLNPDPLNAMFGRAGFLMHGDNQAMNRTASDGCIIMARDVREAVWNSGDHQIRVVPGPPADLVLPPAAAPASAPTGVPQDSAWQPSDDMAAGGSSG